MSLVPWIVVARHSIYLSWTNERLNDVSLATCFEKTLCPPSTWVRFSNFFPAILISVLAPTTLTLGRVTSLPMWLAYCSPNSVKSWTWPCSLVDVVHSKWSCMFKEWMEGCEQTQYQRNKDDRIIPLSHRISIPHILLGHGHFQGPEQDWVYSWGAGKGMGPGTRKVILSSAFSSTTRNLSSAVS